MIYKFLNFIHFSLLAIFLKRLNYECKNDYKIIFPSKKYEKTE